METKRFEKINRSHPKYLSNLSADERLKLTRLSEDSLLKLWRLIAIHFFLDIDKITLETDLAARMGKFSGQSFYLDSFGQVFNDEFGFSPKTITTLKDLISEIEKEQVKI